MEAGCNQRVSRGLRFQNIFFRWFDCPFRFDENLKTEIVSDLDEVYLLVKRFEHEDQLRVGGVDRLGKLDLSLKRLHGLIETLIQAGDALLDAPELDSPFPTTAAG